MTDLFDLTYEVAVELGIVTEGQATGGTTSTIIDTNDRKEKENYWDDGTAWILYDAGGAGAAPQGEYSIIDSWVKATNTATLRSALSVAAAAGDRYAFGKPKYPLDMLIQGVNRAVRDLPLIPFTDTTTITTAANQTEYTLPIAANLDLRAVYIQTNQQSGNNQWRLRHDVSIERGDIGSADKLVFHSQPPNPYSVKIEYMASHPRLNLYNDKLSEEVNKQRIVFRAAAKVLQLWRSETQISEEWLEKDYQMFNEMADKMDGSYPIRHLQRVGRLTIVSDRRINYPGDKTPR